MFENNVQTISILVGFITNLDITLLQNIPLVLINCHSPTQPQLNSTRVVVTAQLNLNSTQLELE